MTNVKSIPNDKQNPIVVILNLRHRPLIWLKALMSGRFIVLLNHFTNTNTSIYCGIFNTIHLSTSVLYYTLNALNFYFNEGLGNRFKSWYLKISILCRCASDDQGFYNRTSHDSVLLNEQFHTKM